MSRWLEALNRRKAQGLHRERHTVDSPHAARIRIDGRDYLNFCSNDYLGLANDPRIIDALREGVTRYGVGSGASHMVTGHGRAHHALEEALAAFTGRERVLLFSTGYMANVGVIGALAAHGDSVIEDRLNHASLIDGATLSRARLLRYAHGDINEADERLAVATGDFKLLATDGVFSMDGDLAPLPALAQTCRQHNACLMVDDAHGFGVVGATGRGSCEHFGLNADDVPVLVGTLGKAFGTFGAFVAGNADVIEYILQHARSYIYTTAMPPAVAHATLMSLYIANDEPWRRERLHALVARFRKSASEIGLQLAHSETPIQPLIIGDAQRAVAASAALRERGLWVAAIRPPTVPDGSARLRITFSADHELADVDHLMEALAEIHVHAPR